MGVSPKVSSDMTLQGGRHYRGRGLGQLKSWKCVACDAPNTGPLTQGCISCGAGKPGQQVRKPGDPLPKIDEGAVRSRNQGTAAAEHRPPQPPGSPPPRRSLADQVRRAATAATVDYDEVERRCVRAIEQHFGGGYSATERARIYDALEVLITLWEDGSIVPAGGLSLEQTRQLAQKIAPLEMEITDGASTTTAAGERNDSSGSSEADNAGGFAGSYGDSDDAADDADDAGRADATAQYVTRTAVRPAPELLDADHRGDQGGEDDAAGDGG